MAAEEEEQEEEEEEEEKEEEEEEEEEDKEEEEEEGTGPICVGSRGEQYRPGPTVRIPKKRSSDPKMARWIMMGRCFVFSSSM